MQRVVLVTGGTGLVGNGIKSVNVDNNKDIFIYVGSKDANLKDLKETSDLFLKHKPTHVIHLAAKVGGLFANMEHKVEFFEDNMLINMNILKCCKDFGVMKCISCLSTCIFPDKTEYPIDENMVHNGPPHSSNEGYAYAKRMIDVLNRSYNDEYNCKFTSIIPTNIYGPHDNYKLDCSHVIPGLIHKAYLAKKNNEPFVVFGSGTPLRQFIHSEDLGRLIMWVLENYDDSEPIILSVGEEAEVSIEYVAKLIAKNLDISDNMVQFDKSKADGQYKKTASNAKLMKLNPEFQFTGIEDGIQKTIEWFKNNYDIARK